MFVCLFFLGIFFSVVGHKVLLIIISTEFLTTLPFQAEAESLHNLENQLSQIVYHLVKGSTYRVSQKGAIINFVRFWIIFQTNRLVWILYKHDKYTKCKLHAKCVEK